MEGNPCCVEIKHSKQPFQSIRYLGTRKHFFFHCFGTVVGLGAPQEWKCSETQFLWAEEMVFVSPGEVCIHHLLVTEAPNAQKSWLKI